MASVCSGALPLIWPTTATQSSGSGAFWLRSREVVARLVVGVHAASFLIGRGGKKVKLHQEDSGARIRFRQGSEAPAGLHCDDRLVEISGGPEELEDGLNVLLSEMDRIPEALASRSVRVVVPAQEELARRCEEEAAAAVGAGCVRLLEDGAALVGRDAVLEIEGPLELRILASCLVAAFLARHSAGEGDRVPPPRPALRSEACASATAAGGAGPSQLPPLLARQLPQGPRSPRGQAGEDTGGPGPGPMFSELRQAQSEPLLPRDECAAAELVPAAAAAGPLLARGEVAAAEAVEMRCTPSAPSSEPRAASAAAPSREWSPRPPSGGRGELRGRPSASSGLSPRQLQDLAISASLTAGPSALAALQVLLPPGFARGAWSSGGCCSEIARCCGVQVDLGELPGLGRFQVTFTGSVASNALATFYLQQSLAHHWLVLSV
mmetsp:Transcript_73312/g.238585  ORF Transcript_73312/g.238585 Transcript_73312/m.238585 type:complete len:437 (+) Transcript_73312:65-1375(+)|eukprot:CAMPEP_0203977584 /NCGR_PEP_ID=MMETSP0359-20131031/101689_1 /ASSEMBLY_ACC=CAM_ASM_000338 /TAXON_ID=268821 /ORGANISM="Scrippsiella Hangoei, Strain SHTV-5" /LENGTH=436 /DNA_ID=CAMNT_0050915793 /DNA_START=61 /DNA_END=1367 /DNA_ORIENTATION=-